MGYKICTKRRTDIFWQLLVGTTFIFCALLIYHFLVLEGIISSHESCIKSSQITAEKLRTEECSSACASVECIDISTFILSNMNQSADPCEDFYNFACGNFNENFRDLDHSVMNELTGHIHRIVRDIIETSEAPPRSARQKVKIVYESCMDTGALELSSLRSVLQFLKHVGIRDWPHLNSNFSFTIPTLTEVLGRLSTYKEDTFVRFSESRYGSSSENVQLLNLTVSPQRLTIEDAAELKKLEWTLENILQYAGMEVKDINVTVREFMNFDAQIYELYMNNSEWAYVCEEEDAAKFDILDCTRIYHQNKNWLCRIVESIIRNGRIASRFTRDNVVVPCRAKHYIGKIFELVRNYDERVIANYIALRVFLNNQMLMDFSIRKNLKFFFGRPPSVSPGEFQIELDRWKFCVLWLEEYMPYPLGMMYASKMWTNQANDELNEIVRQYLRATKLFISEEQWIGDSVKNQILTEIEEEKNCIHHFIEGIKNETKMNAIYRKFHPTRTSFMRNVFSHNKFQFITSMLKELDMDNYIANSPFAVNAYGGDDIYLPFGILLPPVFRYGYPNLFNIAKIGQVIGHELGHKLFYFFDDSLSMDNETHKNFNRIKDCLTDQYFKFEVKHIKKFIQANLTIYENFPDNVGIQLTEKVAEGYLRDMINSKFVLPALSYSPEELFYISYAQTWCTERTVETQMVHYERDAHSPPEFRIKGAFQNSEKFSQVFNCPETSSMNPKKKCLIFG